MDEILVVNGNDLQIKAEVSAQIKEFEKQVKEIKEQEEKLKEKIIEAMRANNLIKVETPDLIITYVEPTKRESINSKKLKEEKPDLYLEYVQVSDVKDSIRIKIKEDQDGWINTNETIK